MTENRKKICAKYRKSAKGKAAKSRYNNSVTGKSAKNRWSKTVKGKEAKSRFKSTEKYKQGQKRYLDTPKGKMCRRKVELRSTYSLTVKEYEELLSSQSGCCKICGADKPGRENKNFCIDHDHETGKVRGLLCIKCNTGLGMFKDDAAVLVKALEYIYQHTL